MMDTPETGFEAYQAPRDESPSDSEAAPPSLPRACWLGAWSWARRMAYIIGPLALPLLIAGLAGTAFGLGAGRGFGVTPLTVAAVGMLAVVELCGATVGLVLGPTIARLGRSQRGVGRGSRLSFLSRSVRLVPWRKSARPPRAGPRRWPWIAAAATILILVAAFGAGIYAGRYVDRRLAEAIAASDRDDPNWRLDDLMAAREPVPDEENAALVVAEVVSMLPDGWPGSRAPGSPGAEDEVAKAAERMKAIAANERLDDATAATLRDFLDAQAEAVELAREVVDYRTGRHELESRPNPFDILLPETQDSRLVARLLEADAAIRAHDGHLDDALDSGRAIFGVARSIGDEPFLISQLVRTSIGRSAADSARRVLGQGEPSDQALARFQAAALAESAEPFFRRGLSGERAMVDEMIRRMRDGELVLSTLSDKGKANAPAPPFAPWGRLMFDHQRAVALEWMNELMAISLRPTRDRLAAMEAWKAKIDRWNHTRFAWILVAYPLLMLPDAPKADTAFIQHQARLGATAILLAAERHRRKRGDWPGTIDAIDPGILADPPIDPYSGKPFLLDRRDRQLLIYSVGPNLKDEHGAFDPKTSDKGGPDDVSERAWDAPLRRRPPGEPADK